MTINKKSVINALLTTCIFAGGLLTVNASSITSSAKIYQDRFGMIIKTQYKKINEGKESFIPVEAITSISPYSMHVENDKLIILLPKLKYDDKGAYISDYDIGEIIKVPVKTIADCKYIEYKNLGYRLGVLDEQKKRQYILKPMPGRIPKINKIKINTKIGLFFDPVVDSENPYKKAENSDITMIMAPSLYELTESGIKERSKRIDKYVESYTNKNFMIWPLITNQFDPELTNKILSDKKEWQLYAEELANKAYINGYTGYNFDFENIDYNDRDKLTKFVSYLGQKLNDIGIYTTMDVTGYSNSLRWSKVYDRKELAKHIDYLVLMAYDQVGRNSKIPGPVASYPWVEKQLNTFITEVPKNKTLLGIPLYMRSWDKTTNAQATLKDKKEIPLKIVEDNEVKENNKKEVKNDIAKPSKAKTLSQKNSDQLIKKYGSHIKWLPELKLFYLEYVDDGIFHQIWFENKETLKMKLDLSNESNIAGVAFWRKDFESKEMHKFICDNISSKN